MKLAIEQEGKGPLELLGDIPEALRKYVLPTALPLGLKGEGFKALFQQFMGKGFSVWFSRYWMTTPTILRATGDIPTLELRISLRNQIKGRWDKIAQPELPEYYYQFGFVPYVVTRAIFESASEYQTFDIHFELSFLEDVGIDYKTFQQFIGQVLKDQPAELAPHPRPCPPMMIDAIHGILKNSYSPSGKAWLLQNNVANILLAALEDVDKDEVMLPELTEMQREALLYVRQLIEEDIPNYRGNDKLCQKSQLNLFVLSFGFKRLFGVNPYEYYSILRMEKGKVLLRSGESVNSVSMELQYESGRAFGKAFKARFGYTPKEYQLSFR